MSEVQICSNCSFEKNVGDFYFRKDLNTYRRKCKKCCLERQSKYRKNNKEKIAVKNVEYKQHNKEKIAIKNAEYYQNNKKNFIIIKETREKQMKIIY